MIFRGSARQSQFFDGLHQIHSGDSVSGGWNFRLACDRFILQLHFGNNFLLLLRMRVSCPPKLLLFAFNLNFIVLHLQALEFKVIRVGQEIFNAGKWRRKCCKWFEISWNLFWREYVAVTAYSIWYDICLHLFFMRFWIHFETVEVSVGPCRTVKQKT